MCLISGRQWPCFHSSSAILPPAVCFTVPMHPQQLDMPAHTRRLGALARHLAGPDSLRSSGNVAMEPTAGASYNSVRVEVEGPIATLVLSRPKALNSLNKEVMEELTSAVLALDQDPSVKVMILTGEGTKAFAAGADIKEMAGKSYSQAYNGRLLAGWDALHMVRKPIIAAVNGYALGGGCELAMMCDIIIAADIASFGQPEITLGIIPGMGGTQRLTRAVGKSRAMEMVLTGNRVSAAEAAGMGLVSRVVPQEQLMAEARKVASKIAEHSTPVIAKAKESVNAAFETTLAEGLRFEQREFWSCFALEDQKLGMEAFVQKLRPEFKNK